MECSKCCSLLLMIFVALANSLTYDRMDLIRDANRRNGRISRRRNLNTNRNGYTNGLVGTLDPQYQGMTSGGSCYDICYDVYVLGMRRGVSGCSCSRFDFGNRGGIRRNNQFQNCNCPFGTECDYRHGTVSCISSRQGLGSRQVYVHGNNRANLGIPGSRRLGGHCGYLTSACRANHDDHNQVLRYTYSYQQGMCVREHVYLGCEVRGSRNNLFATRQGCTRACQSIAF